MRAFEDCKIYKHMCETYMDVQYTMRYPYFFVTKYDNMELTAECSGKYLLKKYWSN